LTSDRPTAINTSSGDFSALMEGQFIVCAAIRRLTCRPLADPRLSSTTS
jgi:hypothetical protein